MVCCAGWKVVEVAGRSAVVFCGFAIQTGGWGGCVTCVVVVVDGRGGVGRLMGGGDVEGMGGWVGGSVGVGVGGVMGVECSFGGGFGGGADVCVGCVGCVDEHCLLPSVFLVSFALLSYLTIFCVHVIYRFCVG